MYQCRTKRDECVKTDNKTSIECVKTDNTTSIEFVKN